MDHSSKVSSEPQNILFPSSNKGSFNLHFCSTHLWIHISNQKFTKINKNNAVLSFQNTGLRDEKHSWSFSERECSKDKQTRKNPRSLNVEQLSHTGTFVYVHSLWKFNHKSITANDVFHMAAFSGWITMTRHSSEWVCLGVCGKHFVLAAVCGLCRIDLVYVVLFCRNSCKGWAIYIFKAGLLFLTVTWSQSHASTFQCFCHTRETCD